jgi:hypothetical protein
MARSLARVEQDATEDAREVNETGVGILGQWADVERTRATWVHDVSCGG